MLVAQANKRGSRVRLVLELANATSNYVNIGPPTVADGFSVMNGSQVVWKSPRRLREAGVPDTLLPEQVVFWSTTWNGRPNQPGVGRRLPPGTYTVQASRAGYTATTTLSIVN